LSLNLSREKQEIRERMRAIRQALSPEDVEKASYKVAKFVLDQEEVGESGTICSYASVGKEVQTRFLLRSFLRSGKRVIIPDWEGWRQGFGIRVVQINSEEDLLVKGRIVPQPRIIEERIIPVEEVDLFLVPGLAFDRLGNRLGMGGGYFDRLLKLVAPEATLIGLGFEFQLFKSLPAEAHDVPVHKVVTSVAARSCRDFL